MTPDGEFFQRAIFDLASLSSGRVLDFGCGVGALVSSLAEAGFDSHGCDVVDPGWQDSRLQRIERSPYRLPYEDSAFDVVVSTSVLKHAQNTSELFRKISRVLRPGGWSMHIFPSKWYLPSERSLDCRC